MPQRMTIREAQQIFASLMATARTRPLTAHEKSELSYARQQLRADRKGARRNPKRHPRGERDSMALAELARRTTTNLAPDANFQVKFSGYYAHFAREADARNYYRLAKQRHPRSTYLYQKIGGRWKKIPGADEMQVEGLGHYVLRENARSRRAAPAPRPFGPGDTVAYRGYLIGQTMTGDTGISADGFHISWAKDLAAAKKIVDSLIDPEVRWNRPQGNPRAPEGAKGPYTVYGRRNPDSSEISYIARVSRFQKAWEIFISNGHGAGYILDKSGNTVYSNSKPAPYTPLFRHSNPRKKTPKDWIITGRLANGEKIYQSKTGLWIRDRARAERFSEDSARTIAGELAKRHGPGVTAEKTHPPGFVRSNPGGQVRMGRLVELRYQRDHGASRGFYKHEFKVRPTIYYRPSDNTVWIKGGK